MAKNQIFNYTILEYYKKPEKFKVINEITDYITIFLLLLQY